MWFLGQPLEIKVTGEQTGGAYAVTEAIAAPGFGPAPHIHRREAEGVYVIEESSDSPSMKARSKAPPARSSTSRRAQLTRGRASAPSRQRC